jgi:hypothetical protein
MKQIYLSAITLFLSFIVAAQAPGGIGASNNLSLWIRSDIPSTLSSTDSLNSWTYYNIPANVFTSSPHNRPIIQASSFNFLPGVLFNGAQEMDGPTGLNAPIRPGLPQTTFTNPSYAIFAVWSSNVFSATAQRVWSQCATGSYSGNGDCGSLWIFNGEYGARTTFPLLPSVLG